MAPVDEWRPLLTSSDSPITSYTETGAGRSHMKSSASEDSIDTGPKNKFLTLPPRSRAIFYSFPNTPNESHSELSHESANTSAMASVSTSDVEDSDSESGPHPIKKRRSTLPTQIKVTVPQKQEGNGQGWLRRTLTVVNDGRSISVTAASYTEAGAEMSWPRVPCLFDWLRPC